MNTLKSLISRLRYSDATTTVAALESIPAWTNRKTYNVNDFADGMPPAALLPDGPYSPLPRIIADGPYSVYPPSPSSLPELRYRPEFYGEPFTSRHMAPVGCIGTWCGGAK